MSRDEVDAALARFGTDCDRIAAALLDLDGHPGHVFLRGNTRLAGRTLSDWAAARERLGTLWRYFDAFRSTLDSARAVRARRGRPSDEDLAELTDLLAGPSVELSRDPIPLGQRSLTGPTETVRRASLAELLERMDDLYAQVADVVAAVDATWSDLVARLAPVERSWQDARALAATLGLEPGAGDDLSVLLDRVGEQVAGVQSDAFADPVGLGGPDPTGVDRVARVDAEVGRLRERLDMLAAVRAGFDRRAREVADLLGRVEAAQAAARQVRAEALAAIASPNLPELADAVSALRGRLAALSGLRDRAEWQRLAEEVAALERDAAAALEAAGAARDAAGGLLDRRAELRGRLESYRAMAARFGRIEDAGLAARYQEARDLLWTAPCDLRAATVAVARYQQAVRDGTGPSGVAGGGVAGTGRGGAR